MMALASFAPQSLHDAPVAYPGLELLATAVLMLDDERIIRYANPAAENLFELSRARLDGMPIGALFADAGPLVAAIESAAATHSAFTEQEIELGVTGKAKLHLTVTVSPLDALDVALLLEFRHIDQQLKIAREERQLEQQQANRELIRNLAHEIKNPLGGIRGAAQLLERELDRPQLNEYTQVIIGEADRLQSLVNRLLTPHRLPSYRRTNVHELLVRVKGVVQAEFPAIPIVADFDTSLPEIEADPEQLTQAVLNIVRNAAQALDGTTSGPRDPADDARRALRDARAATASAGDRDRRRGQRARAFRRRSATASSIRWCPGGAGGSGLGLTIAQTFVAQHNGTIECESQPGATVFRILLPFST